MTTPPFPVDQATQAQIDLVWRALPRGPMGHALAAHFVLELLLPRVADPAELDELLGMFGQYALDEVWPPGWPTVSDLVLTL